MEISSSKLIRFIEALLKEASKFPKHSSKYSRKDFTLRQHVAMLCIKIKLR